MAYREVTNSLTEDGDFMDHNDILGDEFRAAEADNPIGETGQPSASLPPATAMDRPKSKGKRKETKKDHKKKEIISKAHLGPIDLYGAASKKILHLQGRFPPKCTGSLPTQPKSKQTKSATKPPTFQESNPSSHDSSVTREIDGKGENSIPPRPDS